jgi:hypothetical protein
MLVSLKIAQIHLRQPALHRQHGERVIYAKTGIIRPLIIPMYKEVPVFIIKNLLRTAGMARERFFELLMKR